MKSYLSLIPISARVHRRQNRMTLLCIVFAVFMVTAIFSMAEMGARMEQGRLAEKHDGFSYAALLSSTWGQTLLLTAGVLFLLILLAGVLMISGSINSSVAQRTKFFGMMRCIGMSTRQITRFVRMEALNWCKTAVPIGLALGIVSSWALCAVLRFFVGEEFTDIPIFDISLLGIVSGILIGVVMNIVNSISMSASARIKQYGAMRAVGMDGRQITKMIASEAFTYAFLGCVTGCAIGLLLSKFLYGFLITGHFPYAVWSLPVGLLIVIILFVIGAALLAAYAPAKRIQAMSVTETINEL